MGPRIRPYRRTMPRTLFFLAWSLFRNRAGKSSWANPTWFAPAVFLDHRARVRGFFFAGTLVAHHDGPVREAAYYAVPATSWIDEDVTGFQGSSGGSNRCGMYGTILVKSFASLTTSPSCVSSVRARRDSVMNVVSSSARDACSSMCGVNTICPERNTRVCGFSCEPTGLQKYCTAPDRMNA